MCPTRRHVLGNWWVICLSLGSLGLLRGLKHAWSLLWVASGFLVANIATFVVLGRTSLSMCEPWNCQNDTTPMAPCIVRLYKRLMGIEMNWTCRGGCLNPAINGLVSDALNENLQGLMSPKKNMTSRVSSKSSLKPIFCSQEVCLLQGQNQFWPLRQQSLGQFCGDPSGWKCWFKGTLQSFHRQYQYLVHQHGSVWTFFICLIMLVYIVFWCIHMITYVIYIYTYIYIYTHN